MDILNLPAIDVHAHYGDYTSDANAHAAWCMSGDAALVAERAKAARTQWTIVSALKGLFPRGRADACVGNDEAADVVPKTPGLLFYAIVNPLQPSSYDQARRLYKTNPHCVGLKFHPEEHRYPITQWGRPLFEFANELGAEKNASGNSGGGCVIKVHSGEQFSMPDDYIPFADEFIRTKTILANIGCGYNGTRDLQARAIQKSKRGNVYTDTSSMMSILPRNIEWTAKEVGADRVLFGTDTPLYFAAMQRARIDYAELPDAAKRLILRENAVKLFGDRLKPFLA
ncbi:MAG: amidohydrolase family protein [Planctomycetota bacterium]|nr:amidohydrolase family protein [Planctomycetota bacterium]